MADPATYPQSDPDQAAMQPETFVNPMVKALMEGAAANAAKPGQLMAPNPYTPGSEEHSWYEDQRAQGNVEWGNRNAVGMLGSGAPMAKPGTAGIGGGKLGIKAYHASPHDFDQFSLDNLGSGEGTSMFAKGIYAAENPHVGKYYYDQFGPDAQMYHLNIGAEPHQFWDWDKPVPIDQLLKLHTQPEHVQAIIDHLNQTGKAGKDLTGGEVYKALAKATSPDAANNALLQAGVPGVKYLDAGSRLKGEGTSNYVMFDPKLIDILKKEKGFDPGALPPMSSGDAFRQQALQTRNDFYHKDVQPIQSQYKENAQTLEDRRIARGYTTPAFKGAITYFDKPWEPDYAKFSKLSEGDNSKNFYSTSDPQLANMYAGRHSDNGEEFYSTGGSVAPLYLNTSKYHVLDAGGGNAARYIDDAKEAAQAAGAPGVTIKNVWDEPTFTKTLPNPQDVHITFPEGLGTVKSKFATQFNPKSTNMLKGGIGVAGAGTVADMVNALNEKKQKQ